MLNRSIGGGAENARKAWSALRTSRTESDCHYELRRKRDCGRCGGGAYPSLNMLNRSIGGGAENAWKAWSALRTSRTESDCHCLASNNTMRIFLSVVRRSFGIFRYAKYAATKGEYVQSRSGVG
jgi:hypothetical protein